MVGDTWTMDPLHTYESTVIFLIIFFKKFNRILLHNIVLSFTMRISARGKHFYLLKSTTLLAQKYSMTLIVKKISLHDFGIN